MSARSQVGDPFVRRHLLVCLAITCITAIGSSAYFHIDEHFQVLEPAFYRLGLTEEWTLPFELHVAMRPWLQPAFYVVIGRALRAVGVADELGLAMGFRLVTGLLAVGSLALFLETVLPWFPAVEERRVLVRLATTLGFLPYLFVRTSSETASMIAFTAAFALGLRGAMRDASGRWTLDLAPLRALACGALLGVAIETRYQTALLALGLVAWLVVIARARWLRVALVLLGMAAATGLSAFVDAWGYGALRFPAWTYFQANLVEGVAATFGAEPPFAYLWLLPANVFFPVVLVVIVLVILGYVRDLRHPVTWSTLPFVLVHNVLAHKEERFLFPIAIVATCAMTIGVAPSSPRQARTATWLWKHRSGAIAKVLAGWSVAMMTLLAVWPLGWNHHVRFTQHLRRVLGDELHAEAPPEFDLGLPAYHPRVYDVRKIAPEELERRIEAGGDGANLFPWLVADTPRLVTGVPSLDVRIHREWSEVPFDGTPAGDAILAATNAYNARARPPLRPIVYRGLYRLDTRR